MAGTDSQKELLTLIRDFASEKSHGERRVVGLGRRIQELRKELDEASAALENEKRLKETVEQEVKGFEVELAINDASIQTLEKRTAMIEEEISDVGSEIDALKSEESLLRDKFIKHMFEMNANIRKFQETVTSIWQTEDQSSIPSTDNMCIEFEQGNGEDNQFDSATIQTKLEETMSEINKEQEMYLTEQKYHKQIQQELTDIERKLSLMENVVKTSKELEELTKQTSEVEVVYASLGEEL